MLALTRWFQDPDPAAGDGSTTVLLVFATATFGFVLFMWVGRRRRGGADREN